MTEVQSLPTRPRGRGRFWLVTGLSLAAVLLAGGAVAWFAYPRPAPPAPPEAKGEHLDPEVASAVQLVRARVLKEPRSAKAWGELGEVFLANELEEEGRVCFAEAERLDPRDPRWPYYQAGVLLNRGEREAAVAYLQRALERFPADGEAVPAAHLRLAETLLALGRADEAEAHVLAALGRR